NSGSSGSGNFIRERGEAINEYAISRSFSLVAAGGYERLHDDDFPDIDAEGATWSAGVRLQPNADSYAIFTYGRHDLRSHFAGEIAWKVTPLTGIYTDYTDSITTGQQIIVGHNGASGIGPYGSLSHVAFDESPVISTLDDRLLNAPPELGDIATNLGIP